MLVPLPGSARRRDGGEGPAPPPTALDSRCPSVERPHRVREPGGPVARVVVDVMLKPEILDPQGKAVHGALPRLGFEGVSDVRQGKRFELEVDGEVTDERLAQLHEVARTLLSNPVIEDFEVHVS
jgi:phosphoribosylformylglycinamidine synthase PurS subunit